MRKKHFSRQKHGSRSLKTCSQPAISLVPLPSDPLRRLLTLSWHFLIFPPVLTLTLTLAPTTRTRHPGRAVLPRTRGAAAAGPPSNQVKVFWAKTSRKSKKIDSGQRTWAERDAEFRAPAGRGMEAALVLAARSEREEGARA